YVADTNNDRVRQVDLQNNLVKTLAGSGNNGTDDGPPAESTFSRPIGLSVDQDGTVFVAEFTGNDIRRIDPAGNVSTLAGGPNAKFRDGAGVDSKFAGPRGLAIDRQQGVLYIADYDNLRIRKISLR